MKPNAVLRVALLVPAFAVALCFMVGYLLPPRSPYIAWLGVIVFFAGAVELVAVPVAVARVQASAASLSWPLIAVGAVPVVIWLLWVGAALYG